MAQFHWNPDEYLERMHIELPVYRAFQDAVAAQTGSGARRLLELGTGTGETARRVLARHPAATLVGVDSSPEMLRGARQAIPAADLRVAPIEDPLPSGPFDVVFSALAVHHLDGPAKAGLFGRVAAELAPGGRFVLGDLVVPEDPGDAVTPIDPDVDRPSTLAEQRAWLVAAGFTSIEVAWGHRDLAVLVAIAP